MIYLLTVIGLPPGGSCTVHIYTRTIHRTTQNKQYIEQHTNGRMRAVPCPCGLHPDICFTTEEKTRKSLSQGSINNQQDASSIQNCILSRNSTSFGHLLFPSSGVISCTCCNWYVSCSCNLTLLGSGHTTCMTRTNCNMHS
jgi:hypothetical protein